MLCNKFLSMDERNFHCWDYRRFVVQNSEEVTTNDAEELQYTMDRINVNFSNYSAWHYRSKLLIALEEEKEEDGAKIINESTRRQELDLILNAAFTDPDDSSAWFYHKWLLGRPDDLLLPVMAKHDGDQLLVAFSRPVNCSQELKVFVNDDSIDQTTVNWQSVEGGKFDTLWIGDLCQINVGSSLIKLELANSQSITLFANGINMQFAAKNQIMDAETFQVLEQELQNCNELLELEPDSKWTLYTKVLIMKTMDGDKYHGDIVSGFELLCQIDSKRRGYYQDQRSKAIVEQTLRQVCGAKVEGGGTEIDLCNKGLTTVYYKERLAFMTKVNLSGNMLKNVDSLLPYLLKCQELILDNNEIHKINNIPLSSCCGKKLKYLSLKSNPICDNGEAVAELKCKVTNVII
jgi:geranylgeranyl transferase type-2 subunit alpha